MGGECLDSDDLAAQTAQVAYLVNHVQQNRAAARLATPGKRTFKVALIFSLVKKYGAHYRYQFAQHAGRYHGGHDRA